MISHRCRYKARGSVLIRIFTSSSVRWAAARVTLAISSLFCFRSSPPLFYHSTRIRMTHNCAIFLLHKALISFLIGSPTGKGDLFLFTIGDQDLIDELSAVIGINPQQGKREELPCALKGSYDRLLAAMQEGQAFRPASWYVRERQRVQVASLDICATMSHQVCFQKAGSGLLPLLEGADGNLLLEQRSRPCGREATLTSFALGAQEAIRRRRAHGEQLTAAFLREVEMLMPLQRFDQRGEKGNEPFGADAVGSVPDQEQGVLNFWPVTAWARALRCGLLHLRMVEEPHRVLAIVARRCRKGIQQFALLLDRRCPAILREHVLK